MLNSAPVFAGAASFLAVERAAEMRKRDETDAEGDVGDGGVLLGHHEALGLPQALPEEVLVDGHPRRLAKGAGKVLRADEKLARKGRNRERLAEMGTHILTARRDELLGARLSN